MGEACVRTGACMSSGARLPLPPRLSARCRRPMVAPSVHTFATPRVPSFRRPAPPPPCAVFWQRSAEIKRQEREAQLEAGVTPSKLQPVASAKGDRFFKNLMPSFKK